MPQPTIEAIVQELNQRSSGFVIGDLQQTRVQLKGLSHTSCKTIFSGATTSESWAFHHGGRTELQFNVGLEQLEGAEYLRHGVAFSLETSRSLQSIDVLIPKVRLFNEFLHENQERLHGFQMWHFDGDKRHPAHQPCIVTADLVREGVFIFLGGLQPLDALDYERILTDFDSLLPLYRFVESGGAFVGYRDSPPFRFRPGHRPKAILTTVTRVEAELSVSLRHNVLQQILFDELCREHGAERVATELGSGSGGRIDAAVRSDAGLTYFELKVGQSLQACIREAIGQLLEYSFWPGSEAAVSLVIVGEVPLDDEGRTYLKKLRESFSIPLSYRQVTSPAGRLLQDNA